jgi:hypothetical protein
MNLWQRFESTQNRHTPRRRGIQAFDVRSSKQGPCLDQRTDRQNSRLPLAYGLHMSTTEHQKPGLPACAGNDDSGALRPKPKLSRRTIWPPMRLRGNGHFEMILSLGRSHHYHDEKLPTTTAPPNTAQRSPKFQSGRYAQTCRRLARA